MCSPYIIISLSTAMSAIHAVTLGLAIMRAAARRTISSLLSRVVMSVVVVLKLPGQAW